MTTLIVIAKETIPGKVKTRLTPALTAEQAANLAAAALDDTFSAVSTLPFSRRILAFDGNLLPTGSEQFEVIPQVSGELDARLGAIFDECEGPTVVIGMDTPQLTAADLSPIFADWQGRDAWLGLAADGGFWALAMSHPNGDLIRGVPMSRPDTGVIQLERLESGGLRVGMLPTLIDVDTIVEAHAVAAIAPETKFASAFRGFIATELVGSHS